MVLRGNFVCACVEGEESGSVLPFIDSCVLSGRVD